jgi:uncharacterized SAM-binding protein YcdF (DUF218 family)
MVPAGIFFLVALMQMGYFLWISTQKVFLQEADLIIVFPGDKNRVDAAYTLAKEGYATNLAVVNYPHEQLRKMAKGHKELQKIKMITSGNGSSTFEDIYNAKEIIIRHQYQSVILVTSSYHMPRSLVLFKTFLLSSGLKIDVQYYPVEIATDKSPSMVMRLSYNEIVKLWGSMIEMVGYQFTHVLLTKEPRYLEAKKYIKARLLFQT